MLGLAKESQTQKPNVIRVEFKDSSQKRQNVKIINPPKTTNAKQSARRLATKGI
jgi:hypothetical protein